MKRIILFLLFCMLVTPLLQAQKVVPMLRIEKSEDGTIRVFDMQGNEIKDGQKVPFDSPQVNPQATHLQFEGICEEPRMMEDVWESTEPEALKVRKFYEQQQQGGQLILSDFKERAEKAVWEEISGLEGANQKARYENPVDPEIQEALKTRIKNERMQSGTEIQKVAVERKSKLVSKPLDSRETEGAKELEKISAQADAGTTANPGPNLYVDVSNSWYSYNYPNLEVQARIKNNGTSTAGSSYVGYYLSTNDIISTGDTEIGEDYVVSLSAGSYSDENEVIDISSYPGTWYIGFYADHKFQVSEDDEGDNTAYSGETIDIPTNGGPDLTVGDPSTYSYSEPNLTIDIRVQNDGNQSAGASYLGYYLSTDTSWDTSDPYLGQDYVMALSPGGYSDETATFDLGTTGIGSGTYYVYFYIDRNDDVAETDESNNLWYFTTPIDYTPTYPNLAPVAAYSSFNYSCPNLTYNIRVENNGGATAGYSHVGYYVSTNDIISTGDYLIGEDYVSSLSAGSYSDESETIDLSTQGLPTNIFWVGYIVDYKNEVSELDGADNDFVWPNDEISHPCPNLTIDSGNTTMSYSCPGETLTYNVRVINNGAGPAPESYLGYYLSQDTNIETSDFYLGEDYVAQLSAGAYSSESETFDLNTKSVPRGTWYVAFIVDHRQDVSESDGSDNAWYWGSNPIDYPCPSSDPDLSIETSQVGGVNKIIWACPNLEFQVRVKNIGDQVAGSSYLGYYLSTNTIISTGDLLLADDYVPTLNPAEYSNEDETIDLSTKSLADGSYYAGIIVDYKGQVSEKREDNNAYYWDSPKITWPCVPDLTCPYITYKSGSVQCGDAFYIRPNIKNIGGDAGPSHANLFLSTDNDFNTADDYWVQPKKSIPALPANVSTSPQWDFTFPDLGPGPKTIWGLVHVDCDNEVAESNESNVYKMSSTISYNCVPTYVQVLVPDGHEMWMPNSMHIISWGSSTSISHVRLDYSTDGGSNWTLIANNVPNTGCYEWVVPNVASQRARIRVQDASSSSVNDLSDANFAIGELPRPYIIPSSISGETGEKVVDILIKGNTRDISAFGLTLTYDPAHLNFVQVEKGGLTQDWIQISGSENVPGEVTIGGFHTSALSTNQAGSIARVRFDVQCNGCTECSQSHLVISNLLDHVQGMNIGYGTYSYSSPCALGDVNMDGNITPADALCAFQIYLNGGHPTPGSDCDTDCALLAADANCNGTVTPEDALLIFKAYLDGKSSMDCPGTAKKAAGHKELLLKDIAVVPGEAVKIPIRVNNTAGMNAFGASLNYPVDVLEFKGFERSNYTAEWFNIDAFEAEVGLVRFGGFDPNADSKMQETELLTLCFVAKENAASSGDLELLDPVDALTGADVQTAAISVTNLYVPESFGLAQNYPNPFNMKTEIVYRLTEANFTELSIVDIRGNHVRTLVRGNMDEGIHRLSWNGYSDQGAELATGIYFAILKSGSQHTSIKMALIK